MRRNLIFLLMVLLLPCSTLWASNKDSAPHRDLWRQFDGATQNRQPQTAARIAATIARRATAMKDWPTATTALILQIQASASFREERQAEQIRALEAARVTLNPLARSVATTVLASWYWEYYRFHARQISSRSKLSSPGKNFTEWDSVSFYKNVSRLYDEALIESARLKKESVTKWERLLGGNRAGVTLRPTLFDFVAHEAIRFHSEVASRYTFTRSDVVWNSGSQAFASAEVFLRWKMARISENDDKSIALKIFQQLLSFHPVGSTPFIKADLDRLAFVRENLTDVKVNAIYLERLNSIARRYPKSAVAAFADACRAHLLDAQGKFQEAYAIASTLRKVFPHTDAAEEVEALLSKYTKPSLQISGRSPLAPQQQNQIAITYRNLSSVWVKIIPVYWEGHFRGVNSPHPSLDNQVKERRWLLDWVRSAKGAVQWEMKLLPGVHFKNAKGNITLPPLAQGFYFVAVSGRSDFAEQNNEVGLFSTWVSPWTIVWRTVSGQPEGTVRSAAQGTAVVGAKVTLWDVGRKATSPIAETKTDALGFFRFSPGNSAEQRYLAITAELGGQRGGLVAPIGVDENVRKPSGNSRKWFVFFTDRAIYRPGQVVQFKALAFSSTGDHMTSLPRTKFTVKLNNPSRQAIQTLTLTTNEYGSASGRFVLPPLGARLGRYSLEVEKQPLHPIEVEEYRKPSFQVDLEPPKGELKLNGEVRLSGRVTSFSGVPLSDARVNYFVNRSIRIPHWWLQSSRGQIQVPVPDVPELLASGEVRVTDGAFSIAIPTQTKAEVPSDACPQYAFQVHVRVTDSTGEMQATEILLNGGVSGLDPQLEAPRVALSRETIKFKVQALNSMGIPQPFSKGALKVYTLKPPATVELPPPTSDREFQPRLDWSELPRPAMDWETGSEVRHMELSRARAADNTPVSVEKLPPGAYRSVLQLWDSAGQTSRVETTFLVLGEEFSPSPAKLFSFLETRSPIAQVGTTFEAWWGTGMPSGRALVEIERGDKLLKRYYVGEKSGIQRIALPIGEELRGGFSVRVTLVSAYRFEERLLEIQVPWDDKELTLTTGTFRNRLEPGQKETWSFKLRGPQGAVKAAEMVATLYDGALDALDRLDWDQPSQFWVQKQALKAFFPVVEAPRQIILGSATGPDWSVPLSALSVYPNLAGRRSRRPRGEFDFDSLLFSPSPFSALLVGSDNFSQGQGGPDRERGGEPSPPKPSFSAALPLAPPGANPWAKTPRKNLSDVAFFLPHLTFNDAGESVISFELPENLTTWRLMALAHTTDLASGFLTEPIVASKTLMVEPFLPRFLRAGDTVRITARVSALASAAATGTARLQVRDAFSREDLTRRFLVSPSETKFAMKMSKPQSLTWSIRIPPGHTSPISLSVSADSGTFSDGEERAVPILSDKVFLTDSKAFTVRKAGDTSVEFPEFQAGLKNSKLSTQAYVVEYTPYAAWTVLESLGWLAEFPYECAEQTFQRLFANVLTSHILKRVPEASQMLAQWAEGKAPSTLDKNPDLKKAALSEAPWLNLARSEAENRQHLAQLFSSGSLSSSIRDTQERLRAMQLPSGAWPWYPGGPANEVITLHIVSGVARLKSLGITPPLNVDAALKWLDSKMEMGPASRLNAFHPSVEEASHIAYWLYARSQFPKRSVPAAQDRIATYWTRALENSILTLPLMGQAHVALVLHALGRETGVRKVLASLRETALLSEESGMYWADLGRSQGYWYDSPVETQAALIELFSQVAKDEKAVNDLKAWLVFQKRARAWSSTKATADAAFALLLRGKPQAAEAGILLAGETEITNAKSIGSGYFRKNFVERDITPALGHLTVRKTSPSVSWGAMHWQYFAPLTEVPSRSSGITIQRALFVADGEGWKPAGTTIPVGARIRVRLQIRADRDFEFVHLRDLRGAGLEPVEMSSGYRSQGDFGYYQMSRDTGTDFFIDQLPKGLHVMEYELLAQFAGEFDGGYADLESLYAPEFRGRSPAFGRMTIVP